MAEENQTIEEFLAESRQQIAGILAGSRRMFEDSTDATMGVEEEFAIVDPESLDLVEGFFQMQERAAEFGLGDAVSGELIASEIEFHTQKCENHADMRSQVFALRSKVLDLANETGYKLAATSTHPWADYRQQSPVELPYYTRFFDQFQYAARRNNTFGLHVHVGVQGADRAIAVSNELRRYLPLMLALSASSPFLDGTDSGLASARSVTFARLLPRALLPPIFTSFAAYERYVRMLADSGSIDGYGQMWWGTRLHGQFGTIELRVLEAQPDVRDTVALASFTLGLILHLCDLHDEGHLPQPIETHLIEENMWRATRWGMNTDFIDFASGSTVPAREWFSQTADNARAAASARDIDLSVDMKRVEELVDHGNWSERQRRIYQETGSLRKAYASAVEATMSMQEAANVRSRM